MAKLFSRCLGKIVLMTAAALWAGCSDSEKADDTTKQDKPKFVHPWDFSEYVEQKHAEKNVHGNINDDLWGCLYGCGSGVATKSRGNAKFSFVNVESADKQALDQERYLKVAQQRTPGLRHVYNKFLKKKADSFAGEITVKLIITEDGSVKKIQIVSSTTGYTEFDEEIKTLLSRWIFPKVESGEAIAVFSIKFYENAEISSSSQLK
ncbi:MAG: AgmX/PglI C-terminal domain-containing protein [Fibrobacter sp.]|nr:AgmX/PglI C-terminal domain-containing protein [Fibrobacter sp.]